ncbi:DNA-binding response regulator [Desulfuribacillus stibiiarsenatis]|uniref:DNA-binding response regulator n=1 Tax=Desulfuribacillus stibiiarsenatis TaxID=1390249 RepID=A0A1E5L6L6_9FIRM|nr:response regulator transcription factor [Desulfuribacillus stibiiarsenatis]OEH85698.1 DNA-binding response regulator [Desulfuribacillus stibiiarsenatis]
MDLIRVLLVDDHILFRKGLVNILNEEQGIEVAGEASNGEEAIEKARELMPDVILMDINMPKYNGLEATKIIKSEMPYVKIVMLTVSDDDDKLFESIKAGAQGYLLKNLEPEDLVTYLLGVMRGETPISGLMATKIFEHFTDGQFSSEPKIEREKKPLTKREIEVLQLVIRGATNRDIATELHISENTVKNHLRNIMEKLHMQNRIQAATYALKEGLIRDV